MSARSESATSPTPCACTNISLMQLFHELKQKFPGVPDHVVSNTIELYCHDKQACETHLHSEVKASLTHAYHASSSAAARQLSELKVNPPGRCRNQPITKHEAAKSTVVQSITCQAPQTAVLSSSTDKKLNTDANQNVVEPKNDESERKNNNTSPVTVINIDNCYAKYSTESPSDLELTNNSEKEEKASSPQHSIEQPESTNYRILKSRKIQRNLHERLEKGKEKKTIKKGETTIEPKEVVQEKVDECLENKAPLQEEHKPILQGNLIESKDKTNEPSQETLKETSQEDLKETSQDKLFETSQEKLNVTSQGNSKETSQEKTNETSQGNSEEVSLEKPKEVVQAKPTRPNTLNFIKPNPDIAFKPTLKEPEAEPCRTVSPAPKQDVPPTKEKLDKDKLPYRPVTGYPLNLSVNVNCHMDYSRGYDPWLEDYDSPRAITSVNLTVCTPTSNMASPVRESREDDGGFEGHVTVTVSPSTTRPPRRPAPPPPTRATRLESPRPTRAAPEPPGSTNDRSLIERQKERLGRMAAALAQEKSRLAQLSRETQILAAPPPPPHHAQRLREYVERLRDQCDTLAKRLEMGGSEQQDREDNFYSNIYTGQRPPTSWQCHMCTFRNHPLLDKCEECDMPRIFVGMSPARTHDSGFGSFRDRNRKPINAGSNDATDVTDFEIVNLVEDVRALPKLNC